MAGNSIGKCFKVTTFGESHGPAIGCIIDGCPSGLELSEMDIQPALDRRKPGSNAFTTKRREADQVIILSGVFEGKTTGTPIALQITNQDQRSQDYNNIKETFRPGHADFTYYHKYGIRDYRGGGRSSARETAMRVAAGAVAQKLLKQIADIEIQAYLSQMGAISAQRIDYAEINNNPFFSPDVEAVPLYEELIRTLRKEGNSIGAKVSVLARNVPVGLGEPVFDRLDADLAHGLMSINAVKGVEIGDGFDVVHQKGSEHRDPITPDGFSSNHAGGILGGISSGQEIIAHVALKPTSSIAIPEQSIDFHNQPIEVATHGRHDPCVGIRAVPVVEAMMAIILLDHLLRAKAQPNLFTLE